MAGCVLRVGGENFSASEFLRGTGLEPYRVEETAFMLSLGHTDGDDLAAQIADATKFLRHHRADLERLSVLQEVGATLDFGVYVHDFPAQFIRFPAKLLHLAGSLGIDIELSLYAASEEETL